MSFTEETGSSERDFEHELYKQIANEGVEAIRKWKYGTYVDSDGLNHHARESDNDDCLAQRISYAIDARDLFSREITLRKEFHENRKERWENGIHKGILEQIALKEGLVEKMNSYIISNEALLKKNYYHYNQAMSYKHEFPPEEAPENNLAQIPSNNSISTTPSQQSYSAECAKTALDAREELMSYLNTHIDDDVIINPNDSMGTLSDVMSLSEPSDLFPLSNTTSPSWYEYDSSPQVTDQSYDTQGDSQKSSLESPTKDGDIRTQEENSVPRNSIISDSDLATLRGKKKLQRSGRGLGPPVYS